MGNQGWICLHRKIQENFLWKKARVFSELEAWLDILLNVQHSHETTEIMIGMTVLQCGYGQSLKSIATWADRWMWTESKVRRFLNLLKDRGMISTEGVRKTTRITVCNFQTYNTQRSQSEVKVKSKRRANDDRQQCNNVNNGNNKEKSTHAKRLYGEFVWLTDAEHAKLVTAFGAEGAQERIKKLDDGIGSKGYKYKSHYRTILVWERRDGKHTAGNARKFDGVQSQYGTTISAD
jgi:hypothetical protein